MPERVGDLRGFLFARPWTMDKALPGTLDEAAHLPIGIACNAEQHDGSDEYRQPS
ncbi:MAG TPA: hypothetical protein VKH81_16885 [Candidatus Angelobacter sp.]|nr:hypothetical protein [Candidatus Angelobacter sp.]